MFHTDMAKLTATDIRKLFHLEPHPIEGGYFVRTYVSQRHLPVSVLPQEYPSARPVGTAIYYLLTPDTFSALHRLPGDEIFHFYLGDPVEMLELRPDGTTARTLLRTGPGRGHAAPARHLWWRMARLATVRRRRIRSAGHHHGCRI